MRLFTALDLPPDILLRLEELLSELKPTAAIKWSPLDNLHITTKFIGEWPDEQLGHLDTTVQPLRFRKPFAVSIKGLGWFPDSESPRTLWAGVHAGPALHELAAETDRALAALGVAKDPKAFSPHLTLARIKTAVPLQTLRAKAEQAHATPFGEFTASRFYLYRSDPGPNSSTYQKIRTYPFAP